MVKVVKHGNNNTLIVAEHDDVVQWMQSLADNEGFADRESCTLQTVVKDPLGVEEDYTTFAVPELTLMVSNIAGSKAVRRDNIDEKRSADYLDKVVQEIFKFTDLRSDLSDSDGETFGLKEELVKAEKGLLDLVLQELKMYDASVFFKAFVASREKKNNRINHLYSALRLALLMLGETGLNRENNQEFAAMVKIMTYSDENKDAKSVIERALKRFDKQNEE